MATQRSRFVKFIHGFLGFAAGVAFIVFGLILCIVIALAISGRHDKQSIEAAVNDIKLPAQYSLISSTYDNQRCLDVCAHRVLTYKSADGTNLSEDVVISELKNLGYIYDGYYYSKTYNNKMVHVSQTNSPPTEITLDVSL